MFTNTGCSPSPIWVTRGITLWIVKKKKMNLGDASTRKLKWFLGTPKTTGVVKLLLDRHQKKGILLQNKTRKKLLKKKNDFSRSKLFFGGKKKVCSHEIFSCGFQLFFFLANLFWVNSYEKKVSKVYSLRFCLSPVKLPSQLDRYSWLSGKTKNWWFR